MRRIVLLLFLTPLFSHAQNQFSEDYFKNLVNKNAAAIGLSAYDLQNNRLSDFYYDAHAKTYMIYLIQTFKGVDVDDVLSPLSFKEDKLVIGHFIALNEIKEKAKNISEKPSITANAAVINAAKDIGLSTNFNVVPSALSNNGKKTEFNIPEISQNKITANLKWRTPDNVNSNYTLVWQTVIHTNNNNALWLVNIDAATGAVIDKKNLTTYENALGLNQTHHNMYVYEDDEDNNIDIKKVESVSSAKYRTVNFPAESPIVAGGTPALANDPWTMFPNTKAITLKWNSDNTKDYDSAFGNNTHVVEDEDNNNTGGVSAHSISALPNLDFDHTTTYGLPTDKGNNREAGLTNLFYWTNLMHDMSYQYGFDEPAGNFQSTNFGRGGAENDYVNADGQDGSGIDNSNFSTPVDGSKPRMQMYFFQPNPDTVLKINSPSAYAGFQLSSLGELNLNTQKNPITSDIVMYNDNGSNSHTACVAASNTGALAGKIVYVDRGTCGFDAKVLNAQNAGAAAVIVGDTVDVNSSVLVNMVYKTNILGQIVFDKAVTIPSSFVKSGDALTIKSYIKGGTSVNATFYSQYTDGELDNGVVCHEYTHGISTRLTGGPNNGTCLTNGEAMNEGWSDYFAIMMTKDWAKAKLTDGALPKTVGNYAIGFSADGPGIRNYPYSTDKTINPETYDFVLASDGETHTIGEVWCEMLWEMTWQIIQNIGSINTQLSNADAKGGNSIALNLMMEGLKLQVCKPGFVDGRDAILKADTLLYGAKYSADIWKAFAKRGLGFSAKEGTTTSTSDGKSAYDLPSVLAVTFVDFIAEKQAGAALLKWTTSEESGIDKFIVERSTDGKNFTQIGEVKAVGNSAAEQSYQFTDAYPVNGDDLYHIKEVDKDGKYNLSALRSLNFADLRPYIKISPNPATDVVTINIPNNNQNLEIRLLSNNGQLIGNYRMSNASYTIDVSKLASGVYNITIDGNGYSTKYKLVIQ